MTMVRQHELLAFLVVASVPRAAPCHRTERADAAFAAVRADGAPPILRPAWQQRHGCYCNDATERRSSCDVALLCPHQH